MESLAPMVGSTVPVGYRFHPTDEELVGHYLKLKLLGHDISVHNMIAEVDVCKFEPWDLPAFSKVKSDDPEWFFFSPVGLKYTNSNRCNRATNAGYWKTTGKDRKIKTRGTNNVIGTKKTLVFYKGRVPRGVKTNWVIHEYHAVTFPDDKRSFVMCRLMEKAEKKADEGTEAGALIHDEEEPSSHIAANCENQATAATRIPDAYISCKVNLESIYVAQPQAEECDFPSLQQSPLAIEQEPCFQGSTFPNAYSGNENSIAEFPLETILEEDDIDLFLNSLLADEDVFIGEEAADAFINESTPSQNLTEVYYESSEKDAELLSGQRGNFLDTATSVCNEHTLSRENQVISNKSSHGAVYDDPSAMSSEIEVNLEKNDYMVGDDFWGVDTAVNSTSKPLSIYLIQSADCPSSQAVSQQEVLKETHIWEADKEQSEAEGTTSREKSESTSNHSTGFTGMGGFSVYIGTSLMPVFRVSFNLEFFRSRPF